VSDSVLAADYSLDMPKDGKAKRTTTRVNGIDGGDVVIGGVPDQAVEKVLDRALKRESRYFRLTDGQRSALRLKR
jgi:hypothetical protein